ncbi:MAG TPA: sigma-70 family RNA polymerase sigma factor [Solirubrobacterales bacterium]
MNEATIAGAGTSIEAGFDFERLYRSSRDDVYAYTIGLLRDRSAAEDATAAAFERAYRKRSRFNPEKGTARAWLFGIARNAALDELRRRSRHTQLDGEPIDPASVEEGESSERRLVVAVGLTRLGTRERELISLKFFAGLSNGEIAGVLGISESNAGTKLHRAMIKLREACDGAL